MCRLSQGLVFIGITLAYRPLIVLVDANDAEAELKAAFRSAKSREELATKEATANPSQC